MKPSEIEAIESVLFLRHAYNEGDIDSIPIEKLNLAMRTVGHLIPKLNRQWHNRTAARTLAEETGRTIDEIQHEFFTESIADELLGLLADKKGCSMSEADEAIISKYSKVRKNPTPAKRTITVAELREHFINQRVKGFQWDRLTHHPMSRQEAEELWNQAGDSIIESLGAGVRKNPSETFKSLPVGATFNFCHELNWLDIAKGPWTKISASQYVPFGATSPRHTVGKPTTTVCSVKRNPSGDDISPRSAASAIIRAEKSFITLEADTIIRLVALGRYDEAASHIRSANTLEKDRLETVFSIRCKSAKTAQDAYHIGFAAGLLHIISEE